MLKVIELFAGVGGFRIGLEGFNNKSSTSNFKKLIKPKYKITWSNQFEPKTKTKQYASDIYENHFTSKNHSREDITKVNIKEIDKNGPYDVLVGGFPCQDYSVATILKHNIKGVYGKKGVLWWEIYRILKTIKKKPKYLILENVDRLLKSPSNQKGRDFAVMLACLRDLGYIVEWRIINAADYGFPQRRRRVFIIAYHSLNSNIHSFIKKNIIDWINKDGVLAKSFRIKPNNPSLPSFSIDSDIKKISDTFGNNKKKSSFLNTGIIIGSDVYTYKSESIPASKSKNIKSILEHKKDVSIDFYIKEEDLKKWRELKGSISIPRVKDGFKYNYSMGGIGFDKLDRPSRTIVTGEGGKSPSRFKHIIEVNDEKGRYRRLTPVELEKLNGFPKNFTKYDGVSDIKRAFLMGNALVCGVVEKIGESLFDIHNKY